jgi:hypothetical protein
MSAIVVNRIRLRVPVQELVPVLEREFPALLRSLPGFERFSVVEAGPNEAVVVIHWATVEDAANGGAVIGPGLFNTHVAPVAESQDRVVGPVVVDIVGG